MGSEDKPKSKIHYWWFRYTMTNELYIVETWEKITIHVLLGLFFLFFAYINYAYVRHLPAILMSKLDGSSNIDLSAHPVTIATLDMDKYFQGGVTS